MRTEIGKFIFVFAGALLAWAALISALIAARHYGVLQ